MTPKCKRLIDQLVELNSLKLLYDSIANWRSSPEIPDEAQDLWVVIEDLINEIKEETNGPNPTSS